MSEFAPVESVLPHRPPFLFVDRIVEMTPKRIVGVRTFHPDEPFFKGHFPGRPIVPGVILVEGLAQTMAYFALSMKKAQAVFLVGIDRARFRGVVEPGTEVRFEIDIPDDERLSTLLGKGRAMAGKRRIADAEVRGYAGQSGGLLS